MDALLQLKGIDKAFPGVKALSGAALNVYPGRVMALVGENGAGKSTTILMMLGLTDPTSGTVQVCRINSTRNPIQVREKVGYLPEDVGFYDDMTGIENLLYTARLNRIPEANARTKAEELLERVGLPVDTQKKAGKYSRGMRQRLGLADVLIKQPEVIILDEPTSGIDPAGVQEFMDLIRQLREENGLTVLFSSHHLDQVQQICDRVGLFGGGKLLAEVNVNELQNEEHGLENMYNRYFGGGKSHE